MQTSTHQGSSKFARCLNLTKEVGGALDRAGYKLGKKCEKKSVIAKAPAGCRAAKIHIERVAHCLESVKADANRENDTQSYRIRVQAQSIEKANCGVCKKIKILEESQDGHVGQNRNHQEPLSLPVVSSAPKVVDFPRQKVIKEGAESNKPEKSPVPKTIEEVTEYEKHPILNGQVALRGEIGNEENACK
jgi:cell division septation protein DedD